MSVPKVPSSACGPHRAAEEARRPLDDLPPPLFPKGKYVCVMGAEAFPTSEEWTRPEEKMVSLCH